MTPSKEKLEDQAKLFANIVFFVIAAGMMLAAFLLKPLALDLLGEVLGEHITFVLATFGIFSLSSKRPQLSLIALDWQCRKYGHVPSPGAQLCQRCHQSLADSRQRSS